MKIKFHPLAELELKEAINYYEKQDSELGIAFAINYYEKQDSELGIAFAKVIF
jgi:hypothetical protein